MPLDEDNARFWDELCGSGLARSLGIHDHSIGSLKKYDDWYFSFYPYLSRHIPFTSVKGKRVLEVGLGYGSVAQHLGEMGAVYTGLDIARGPVAMVNHRYKVNGLNGHAVQGSILDAPFDASTFDCVVAIGSYHHTGNLQKAIDESYRLLRSDGILVMMVYSAYSYRRWMRAFYATAQYFLWDYCRLGSQPISTAEQRAAYDVNANKEAAPHTIFVSRHALANMCRRFTQFSASLENIGQDGPLIRVPRDILLQAWPKFIGLDIYAVAKK